MRKQLIGILAVGRSPATMRSRDQVGHLGPQQPGRSARFQVQGGVSSCVILAHASLLPGPLDGYLCPGPKPGSSVTVHCSPATSGPCAASQSIRGSLKPSLRYFCKLLPGSLAAPHCGSSQRRGTALGSDPQEFIEHQLQLVLALGGERTCWDISACCLPW